jgi:hypothetical protein
MKRGGKILICLASGLVLCAISRADNLVNPGPPQGSPMNKLFLKRHPHASPASAAQPNRLNGAPSDHALASNASSDNATPDNSGNPYASIVTRNVFGLNPIPPAVASPEDNGPPPPKITLTGIMTIFGPPEALFKVSGVVRDGKPPQDESYIFTEGEAQDNVEVTAIDTNKFAVTFNNHGVVQEIPLANGVASAGSAPSQPTWSGAHGSGFGRFGGFHRPGFGGPGNFQPASYNSGPANNSPANNNSGAANVNGYWSPPTSQNNANQQSAQSALSGDDQQALIAAERAQFEQDGNPQAPILPPTSYDSDARQTLKQESGSAPPP